MTNSQFNAYSEVFPQGAVLDVQLAWDYATPSQRVTRDWIYNVDVFTMEQVKAFWRVLGGEYSLYDTFAVVLKMSEKDMKEGDPARF